MQDGKRRGVASKILMLLSIALISCILAVAVFIAYLDVHFGAQVKAERAEISASRGLLNFADFRSPRQYQAKSRVHNDIDSSTPGLLLSESRNREELFEEGSYQEISRLLDLTTRKRSELSAEELDEIELALAQGQSTLNRVREVVAMPPADTDTITQAMEAGNGNPYSFHLPSLLTMRRISGSFALEAVLFHQQGEDDQALQSIRDSLNLSMHLKDMPNVISAMIACVTATIPLQSLPFALLEAHYSPVELLATIEALEAATGRKPYVNAWQAERAMALWIFGVLESGQRSGVKVFRDVTGVSNRIYTSSLFRFWRRMDETAYLRAMEEIVLTAGLPYHEAAARPGLPPSAFESHLPITSFTVPNKLGAHKTQAETKMILDIAAMALSLKGYKQDHGAYPKSLTAIRPQYIERLPVDVFTGDSYLYKTEGDGFVLYSTGPDQKDDGGDVDTRNVRSSGARDRGWRIRG